MLLVGAGFTLWLDSVLAGAELLTAGELALAGAALLEGCETLESEFPRLLTDGLTAGLC